MVFGFVWLGLCCSVLVVQVSFLVGLGSGLFLFGGFSFGWVWCLILVSGCLIAGWLFWDFGFS